MTQKTYITPQPIGMELFAQHMAHVAPDWRPDRSSRSSNQMVFTDGENWVRATEVDEFVYVAAYKGSTADELVEAMDLTECDGRTAS